MIRKALILGGGGFIGSRIAMAFESQDVEVTVIDGFLPRTGARRDNLVPLKKSVIIERRIEDCAELTALLDANSLVIDCMAWTCHRLAQQDPLYDCALNVQSHLHLLHRIPVGWRGNIIYLGSRGQFGNPVGVSEILEDTPQHPADVQGIHKAAAESHFRIFSRMHGFNAASIRLPAVVGPHQPSSGDDIGLFGGIARDLWAGRTIELYGNDRRRSVIHVDDVAETVVRLAVADWHGFFPCNVAGHDVLLKDAANFLVQQIGRGGICIRSAPPDIAAIDIGGMPVGESGLVNLIGDFPRRTLQETLSAIVEAFRT